MLENFLHAASVEKSVNDLRTVVVSQISGSLSCILVRGGLQTELTHLHSGLDEADYRINPLIIDQLQ